MQKLVIGKENYQNYQISGSKNATLPILAASILNKNRIVINKVPIVKDVLTMVEPQTYWFKYNLI